MANQTPKNWALSVYMAADNNLAEECIYALKEMQRIGPGEGILASALFDSGAAGVETKVYDFIPRPTIGPDDESHDDGTLDQLSQMFQLEPAAKNLKDKPAPKNLNAANPDVLREYLITRVVKQKANHPLVILSGHGSGAIGDFLKGGSRFTGLSIPQLGDTFKSALNNKKIDVLGMDSCLMSMAEVCYELQPHVKFIVGSEGFEVNAGWPYQRILGILNKDPQISPEHLARLIVKKYVAYYSDYVNAGISVDQAACDMNQIEDLIKAVKELGTALKKGLQSHSIINAMVIAHWNAQTYKDDKYVDLWDFCDQLRQAGSGPEQKADCEKLKIDLPGICQNVREQIEKFVVKSNYSGAAFQHSHGVSIYFPWRLDEAELRRYKNLRFHEATKWGDFLQKYLRKTKRPMRGAEKHQQKDKICIDEGNTIPPSSALISGHRDEMPRIKDAMPRIKGESTIGSMKNPPTCFFPDDNL